MNIEEDMLYAEILLKSLKPIGLCRVTAMLETYYTEEEREMYHQYVQYLIEQRGSLT